MKTIFISFAFIFTWSATAGAGRPSIRDSLTHPIHVYEGDDALITCVVRDAGDNTVMWKKEDRERHSRRVLTAGENRVTADRRFDVLHDAVNPEDKIVSGGDVWVLVIKDAKSSDAGIYVCEVNSNPVVRSFHKLSVLSRALVPPDNATNPLLYEAQKEDGFDAKNHNYTDCCIAANVTHSCLGFCNIESILDGSTGQDPENCENDFPGIVKCMADGRNHVPCCIQEGVPDICQDVCRGEYTMITDNIKTHFSCSAYTEQTLACIVEGVEILPKTPDNVDVEAISDRILKVSWTSPLGNINNITAYVINVTTLKIFDQDDDIPEDSYAGALARNDKEQNQPSSTSKPPTDNRLIRISGQLNSTTITELKPFTMYEVTVTALNIHGSSLPSNSLRTLTLTPGQEKPKMSEAPKLPDVRGCCIGKGITHPTCLDKLCDPVQSDIAEVTDLMICAPWATNTFSCLTNGIDHSACCKARGLPQQCQLLCSGNVTQIDFSYFKCLKYMSDFSYCLLQGYGVLPGSPSRLRITNIETDYAIVHWDAPKVLGDTVTFYNLHYRTFGTYDSEYKGITKVQPPYILENLFSDTYYEVYIEAVNGHGVGEASSRLIFKTENKLIEDKIEDASFYNVTECCVKAHLSDVCMPLCSYDASMVDIKNLAGICGAEFHTLIRCGAGGRNHGPCCSRRGVPNSCLSLCSGVVVDSLLVTATTCIPFIGNIVQCFEEGTELLPGPIVDLHATAVTDDSITLEWEPPVNSNVTDFIVHYQKVDNMSLHETILKLDHQANTTNTTLTVRGLEKGSLYNLFVVSHNAHGTSLPSSMLIINVTNMELSGKGLQGVPSAPHSLAVSGHSANWVTISWQPSEFSDPSEQLKYNVYFKPASEEKFAVLNTTVTSITFKDLTPNSQYIAYVVAISKKGASLPSETLIAWTDPAFPAFVEPPTVHPISLVTEGGSMTILCIAMGTPMPTISLYISGRLVRQEATRHMVTVIHNVTRDMNQISCYADNGYGTPMQASRRITISHGPHIAASGITIAAHGDTVRLECQVDAHPEPKMLFWRDPAGRVPVIQGGKYDIQIAPSMQDESKWLMHLVMNKLAEADEGEYYCHAENAFGSATQPVSVRIRNTASASNVTQCCMDQNVSSSCMDACSFYLDIDAVIDKPECIGDFDKLMKCAADGSDHRSCCTQWGVPRRCLDWCRGEPLFNNKVCVLSYTKQIMSCFQEGREKLPGPPQNVRMEPIDAHSVFIKWDAPIKNPHTVEMYRVFWRQYGSKTPLKNDTRSTSLKITGLKDSAMYECVVKAGNHLGTSTLTEPIKFTTGDKYITSSTSIASDSSSVGAAVGIVVALLFVAAFIVGAIWFLKARRMIGNKTNGGVAFENPSYLRENLTERNQTQVETSQIAHINGNSNTVAPEGSTVTPQQGWKQESLHVPSSNEVPPSLYEELKLGQDGAGFKRLKP